VTIRIGLDWGTSSLRAWRIADGVISDSRSFPLGVRKIAAGTHAQVLHEHIGDWINEAEIIIGAGMVGSTFGWYEVPYLEMPLGLDDICGKAVEVPNGIKRSDGSELPVKIISGVKKHSGGEFDVMRGEESQALSLEIDEGTVVLPGTHSKWIAIKGGKIVDFRSYFTGELFNLLVKESSITQAISDSGANAVKGTSAFVAALKISGEELTHEIFATRARWLMGEKIDANREHLSGLIIGAEIQAAITHFTHTSVHIIANTELANLYERALSEFGISAIKVSDSLTLKVFNRTAELA
jgi:2-dehydro-3-deoxygalactonokinase